MPPRNGQIDELLTGVGFTALEAAVYRSLVEQSPATGYRVAQLIGKPIANTYKALESLAAKGAVLIEEGDHRRCRAVPPTELLRRLERAFHDRCAAAESELLSLTHATEDDRVYPLRSRSQVFERARSMIEDARGLVLVDAFPEPLGELSDELESAADRGVRVACLTYERVTLKGVRVVNAGRAAWHDQWPGEQLVVVVDAQQHLVSAVERGGPGVVQALWSPSLILSMTQHDGLLSQLIAYSLSLMLSGNAGLAELRAERESFRSYSVVHSAGFAKLTGGVSEEGARARSLRGGDR